MSFKKNITAFIFISILGSLGHFFYEWSGDNTVVGLFFSINESVWEHLKLLFFPTLIYSIGEYIFSKEKPKNYLPSVAIGLYYGMFAIVAIYYLANGILGYDVEFINVGSYYIAVIIAILKKNRVISSGKYYSKTANIFFAVLLSVMAILFFIFGFNPPSLGIFTPPITA